MANTAGIDEGSRLLPLRRRLPAIARPPAFLVRFVLIAAALILIWQAVIAVFQPPAFMLPPPRRVFEVLVTRPGLWRSDAVVTFTEALAGLLAGTAAGILFALLLALLPRIGRVLMPALVVTQALPVFAIAPLLVLWFGFGFSSKIVMATVAIFFPVASAFADGLTRADPALLDLARLHGASRWQELILLRVPAALPALISGIRLAAVYAPLGALFGEWVGAASGLGYAMVQANGRAQTDVVFAALFLVAAMSVALRGLVEAITRRMAPWAPENLR